MAAARDRSSQAMRTKLATDGVRAAEIERFLCPCCAGRSSLDRFAATRCDSPQESLERLRRSTPRSAEKRFDDGRAGRRFHAGRAGVGKIARLSANYVGSVYFVNGRT